MRAHQQILQSISFCTWGLYFVSSGRNWYNFFCYSTVLNLADQESSCWGESGAESTCKGGHKDKQLWDLHMKALSTLSNVTACE